MWSQVIAKDLFSRFDQEGMMNQKVAGEYRTEILSQGGKDDADELIRNFLGRPYSFEPFAKWLNNPVEEK